MAEPIRWGILGCGDVAEHKSGPALWGTPGSEVVAVMRRDGKKAEEFARRHNVPKWYDDADALLADPNVNAVYIATFPDSHAELTLKAANAGKRVLVEKPMARTTDECAAMIDACKSANVPLHVAYYRRFYAKFLHAKALIDDGAIGDILTVNLMMGKARSAPTPASPPLPRAAGEGPVTSRSTASRQDALDIFTGPSPAARGRGGEAGVGADLSWRLNPELSGGGLFWDTGSHRVDIIRMLCGEFAEVKGFSQNVAQTSPADDALACAFRLQNGALGTVLCLFDASPLQRDRLDIVGTDGILLFDSFDADAFSLTRADGSVETFSHPNPSPVHGPFVEALVKFYAGESISHMTGEEGAATNAVLEAMGG